MHKHVKSMFYVLQQLSVTFFLYKRIEYIYREQRKQKIVFQKR